MNSCDIHALDKICDLMLIIDMHKKAIKVHEEEMKKIIQEETAHIDLTELFQLIDWYKTKIREWKCPSNYPEEIF